MAEPELLKPFLKKIAAGHTLTQEESAQAFEILMSGKAADGQVGAFLTALVLRGETVEEITGAALTMRAKAKTITAPPGTIDCCGTGGDQSGTLNISTAVSFVLAGCGVPVAKHGNRAASSKSGAADVLASLGVNLDAPADVVEKCLRESNICFLMAPNHHPSMHHIAPVRKTLGFRTTFNLIGPLSNPAGAEFQLIGVFDAKWLAPMAQVLQQLGVQSAWVVHGSDGLDEITISGPSYVTALKNGKISSFEIKPEDAGLQRSTLDSIRGDGPDVNAQALKELLTGKKNAYRDIVLLNAAAGLVIAGKAADLKSGAALAAQSIDAGRALRALNDLIRATNAPEVKTAHA